MKDQKSKIKYLIIPVIGLVLLAGVTYGTTKAIAADSTNHPPIIQKLVEKFGLNENEVKAVFDEVRSEREAQMQTRFEDRLSQLVTEGKLTNEQKAAIIAKHNELKSEKQASWESWQNMTPELRQADRQAKQANLQKWAEANNINLQYLFGLGGMGHVERGFNYMGMGHGGFGFGHHGFEKMSF